EKYVGFLRVFVLSWLPSQELLCGLCVERELFTIPSGGPWPTRDDACEGFWRRHLFTKHDVEITEALAQLAGLQQVIRRRRARAERALIDREGLVNDNAVRRESLAYRRKQIALQIPGDDDELKRLTRQGRLSEVGAPATDGKAVCGRPLERLAHRVELQVHAEHAESRLPEHDRVPPPAHGDVERPPRRWNAARQRRRPTDYKR